MRVWDKRGDSQSVRKLGERAATPGARRAVMANCADRAVALAPYALGHEGETSRERDMAEAYTAATVRAAPDADTLRGRINALGPANAGSFADAQVLGATPTEDGRDDDTGLARTLEAMNGGPESDASRSYATHVLATADADTFRRTQVTEFGTTLDRGPSAAADPMATQMARLLHPNDRPGQDEADARLRPIMQSPAAPQLFTPDFSRSIFGATPGERMASQTARFQALAAIGANPAITAQALGRDPWRSAPLVQTMAQPGAQAALERQGDGPAALRGTDLDNFVGTAMHLPPDIPKNETPQQAAAREQATAAGQYSYFQAGRSNEPARLVRDKIREASAETGDDPDAPGVTHLPVMVSNGETGPVELPLFRVDGPNGSHFVDNQGHHFRSFEEWQKRNTLPEGTMSVPAGGHLRAGPDGKVVLQTGDTPETHVWLHHAEKVVDKAALVGGAVAGGALVIGSGGALAPVVAGAAGLYMAGRGAQNLYETASRGGSINPLESSQARADWLQLAAGGLSGAGAGAVRSAQALSGSAALSRTMAGGVAAVRLSASAADAAAMANQANDLWVNWEHMTPEERALAGLNMGFWGAGARNQLGRGGRFDFAAQRDAAMGGTRAPTAAAGLDKPSDYVGIERDGEAGRGNLGRTTVVHGPDVDPSVVSAHQDLVHDLAAYSGLEGRLRRLFGDGGAARTPGTRAFTVRAEMDKLAVELRASDARLQAGGLAPEEQRGVLADQDLLRSDLARFEQEMEVLDADPAAAGAPDRSPIQRPSRRARMAAVGQGAPEALDAPGRPGVKLQWEYVKDPETGQERLIAREPGQPGDDPAFRPWYEWRGGRMERAAGDPIRPVAQGAAAKFAPDLADPRLQGFQAERAVIRSRPAGTGNPNDLTVNSNKVGALVAEQAVQDIVKRAGSTEPRRLHGGPDAPSVSGDFDDVWAYTDRNGQTRYVVVEAKGGNSPLETAGVGNNRRAYQGTPEYYDRVVQIMEGRSGSATATSRALQRAGSGSVDYFMVKTPIAPDGTLGLATVQQFDMTPRQP